MPAPTINIVSEVADYGLTTNTQPRFDWTWTPGDGVVEYVQFQLIKVAGDISWFSTYELPADDPKFFVPDPPLTEEDWLFRLVLHFVDTTTFSQERHFTVVASLPAVAQTLTLGLANEVDQAGVLGEPRIIYIGKAVDNGYPEYIEPLIQTSVQIGMCLDEGMAMGILSDTRGGVAAPGPGPKVVQLGVATERAATFAMVPPSPGTPLIHGRPVHQVATWRGALGLPEVGLPLSLGVLNPVLLQAPSALVANVANAIPFRDVNFYIDDKWVYKDRATSEGMLWTSVPVSEANGRRGEHVLSASQVSSNSAQTVFTLTYRPDLLPTNPGPDTLPVDIPASHHPSGVRRWVLQDLMPGGLGSYVLPLNPSEMDNPSFERELNIAHTTAVSGQMHITEGAQRPLEWSFKGYCPTQEMAEKLRAYAELTRRFYIWDHRGRAWVVAITSGELVPRLRQQTIYGDMSDWVHDYTMSGVVYNEVTLP